MKTDTLLYVGAVALAGFALWRLYRAINPTAFATPPAQPVPAADSTTSLEVWDDILGRKATDTVGIWGP